MSEATVLFDAPGPRARRRHTVYGVIGLIVVLALGAALVWALRAELLDPDKWAPFADPSTWIDYFLPGLLATVQAAALAVVLSGILGFLLALARMSHVRVLSWIATAFIEFFRSVPVLMMMLFTNAVLLFNGILSGEALALTGVVTGLTLYNSSVIAELIRSGVTSLPKGQTEAGLAIGLTRQQTLTSILVPQAITAMLPALLSQLVVVLKDTALGYIISYPELIRAAQNLDAVHGNLIASFLVVAIMFILINLGLTSLAGWVGAKVAGRTSERPIMKLSANVTPPAQPSQRI